MSLRIVYEEKAIDQAAGFLADDPLGLSAVLDAIDKLASEPRPAGSFPYGSPDLRRLRVGRYRVMYEIKKRCRVDRAHRTADAGPLTRRTAEPVGNRFT